MENEHLRTAITRAGLTLEEFADIVQVDVKTVRRWLAGRTPYPRHRTRVAGALDTTEHALWPNTVPAPTESPERGQRMPVVTDVVAGYGYATDRDAPNPRRRPARSGGADRAHRPQRHGGHRRSAACEGGRGLSCAGDHRGP